MFTQLPPCSLYCGHQNMLPVYGTSRVTFHLTSAWVICPLGQVGVMVGVPSGKLQGSISNVRSLTPTCSLTTCQNSLKPNYVCVCMRTRTPPLGLFIFLQQASVTLILLTLDQGLHTYTLQQINPSQIAYSLHLLPISVVCVRQPLIPQNPSLCLGLTSELVRKGEGRSYA